MRDLDPYDASLLRVLAQVPANMPDLRQELRDRLDAEGTQEGRDIADALLSPDPESLNVSDDAKATAASLKRAVGAL